MSSRNVNLILAELRKSGELQVVPNAGPRGTNVYRLALPVIASVVGSSKGPASAPEASILESKGMHPRKGASPGPLKDASLPPEECFTQPLKVASLTPESLFTQTVTNHHINRHGTDDERARENASAVLQGATADRLGELLALLRNAGMRVAATDPSLAVLASADVANPDVLAAVQACRNVRDAEGSSQPIGMRFVVTMLERMQARQSSTERAWWTSEDAMLAKGAEVGLSPRIGELWPAFKARIREAIGRAA
jgi:hypothetical protein